jgi:S-layer homology domain.
MKTKRLLCMLVSAALLASLITLPAQAAAKPAFQWLVDATRSQGEYDAQNKLYNLAWYMNESKLEVIVLQYSTVDGNLYCSKIFYDDFTTLVLSPNLDTPYSLVGKNDNEIGEYTVYPGSYTEKTALRPKEFYGDERFEDILNQQTNVDLPLILESISNLMILSGSSYRLKDLGFAAFTRHELHEYTEPKLVGQFVCGGTNYYTSQCRICGKTWTSSHYDDHVKGEIHMVREPTCTEGGYGYYICTRCGEHLSYDRYYFSELGHDWALTALDAPVNDESHVRGQFRCSRCGEEKIGEYCAADFFQDMPARSNWAHTPIDWAYAAGVTAGTSATQFSPEKGCTRGQVVTFLWRAAGEPEPEKPDTGFLDLKSGAFYEKAVAWAVENGITNGTSLDKFSPDSTCTRGQIVTFLWRFKGRRAPKSTKTPFEDLDTGAYYEDSVAWAVENNVTNGMTDISFAPDNTCTRAQVVTFLYRAMHLPAPVEPEPALTDINAMLLRGPSKRGIDTLPKQTVTVSSTKELQDYLESVYEMEYFGGIAPDKYTDAYFVNNVLLLAPVKVCGSSPGFSIEPVTEKENTIEVKLTKPGQPESPDMCAWVLLIEAAKTMSDREVVVDIEIEDLTETT